MRGDRLKVLREERGLTQLDVSKHVQISETQVWRYENGTSEPRADTLVLLAQFFNVSTDYLMGLSDHPGTYIPADELTPNERAILDAFRRGELLEAIKVIVES